MGINEANRRKHVDDEISAGRRTQVMRFNFFAGIFCLRRALLRDVQQNRYVPLPGKIRVGMSPSARADDTYATALSAICHR